jgi:hypothetical protein
MTEVTPDENQLKALYKKAIFDPNKALSKTRFIHCPQCGLEILMLPTLHVMNLAIESHVCQHKEQLKSNPIKQYETAITIRLSLVRQVLGYTCKSSNK